MPSNVQIKKKVKALQHAAEYAVVLSFAALVAFLPRATALRVGSVVGQIGWWLGVRKRVVLGNLTQACPGLSSREIRRLGAEASRNFGRTVVEFLRFPRGDRERVGELVQVEGIEALRRTLAEGRGALVVTGHLGAWALYVTALANQGVPMALLVGRQHNPRINRFILELPGTGIDFIFKGRSSPRGVLRCLGAGKAVVMVADHNAGSRGTLVPFLGKVVSTLPLPGLFVARRQVPLFLMMGRRVCGGRHRVSIERLPVPATEAPERVPTEVARVCNQAIGEAVLEHPEQYYWFHRRFREHSPAPATPEAVSSR